MKYFFLAEGWTFNRVWAFGGLWDEQIWRRSPHIQRLKLGIIEQGQTLWLYQVEDDVLMLEVKPMAENAEIKNIGQVLLKRLISPDQVLEQLSNAESIINSN